MRDIDSVWTRIIACEGETFHQTRGNAFTYRVIGKAIIPDRTPRQLPKSHFERALALMPLRSTSDLQHLQGPSYLYALLTDPRIVPGGGVTAPSSTRPPTLRASEAQPKPLPQSQAASVAVSPTLSLGGYPFARVCALEPDRDASGAIRTFMPQGEYANSREQALNPYGQGPFCRFRIPAAYPLRGVYAVLVGETVMYVGKCDNLSRRFNMGHGQVSPKNCYEGGQNTTCKINHLVLRVAEAGQEVTLWFYETEADAAVEAQLIQALRPSWNGRVDLQAQVP